jgi:ferredoxin
MKPKVDQKKCIGCGLCTSICPEVFELKNSKAAVIGNCKGNEDKCKEAADSCPVQAIKL